MSKIIVTPNEFADIVVSFLLDKLLHPEEVIESNNEFSELIEKMRGKGLRSLFMNYYLSMNSKTRVKYKIIKDIFDEDQSDMSVINIKSDIKNIDHKEPVKKSMLKKIIGKLLSGTDMTNDKDMSILLEYLKEEENG